MSFLRPRVPRVSSLVSPVILVKVFIRIYVKGTLWIKVNEIYAGGDVFVKINGVYQL